MIRIFRYLCLLGIVNVHKRGSWNSKCTSSRLGKFWGGAAQLVMGSMLCPFFRWVFKMTSPVNEPDVIADRAWRAAIIVPGVIAIIASLTIFQSSDDCPKGNYNKRQHGRADEVHPMKAFITGTCDRNAWVLLVQHGCSFGVETTINNLATIYFTEMFGVPTAAAAAIASIFGIMNLFARGLGGFLSDYCYACHGMRGRLICHTTCYILEGLMLIVFAASTNLAGAVIALAIFSIFVQMAEGSTFGIVPNVNSKVTGSATGLVGSGGNVGGVIFSFLLSQHPYRKAMHFIAFFVLCGSMLTFFIKIPGHSTLPRVCNFFERKPEDEQPEQDSALEDSRHVPSNATFASSKAVAAEMRNKMEVNSGLDVRINAHSAIVNRVPKEIGVCAIDDSALSTKQKECNMGKTSISSISRTRRLRSNSSFF